MPPIVRGSSAYSDSDEAARAIRRAGALLRPRRALVVDVSRCSGVPLWWLGLISGVLMACMGFWTAGQFFIDRAYIVLVFAGIWALLDGVGAIARASAVRKVRKDL